MLSEMVDKISSALDSSRAFSLSREISLALRPLGAASAASAFFLLSTFICLFMDTSIFSFTLLLIHANTYSFIKAFSFFQDFSENDYGTSQQRPQYFAKILILRPSKVV